MKKIYALLDDNFKRKAFLLLVMMLLGIFLELLGIGMILPLLKVLASKNIGSEFPQIKPLLTMLGDPGKNQIVVYTLIALVVVYIIKGSFLVFLVWKQSSFAYSLSHTLSVTLLRKYMAQPYAFHLQRNSAELIQNLTNEISQLTGATTNLLMLMSEIAAITGIVILLFAVEPLGALSVMMLFGALAIIFHRLTKKHLVKMGGERQFHDNIRIETLIQSFAGIKDILLLRKAAFFSDRYENANKISAILNTKYTTLQHVPRLWFEVIGVVGLVVIIVIAVVQGKSLDVILPTLAIFVAAAFRIIPSLNRIVASVQTIKYAQPAIELLYDESRNTPIGFSNRDVDITFRRSIELRQVKFNYEGTNENFLEVDIKIGKGQMIGFIGTSGAGKSTIIDLILGLLKPTSGAVEVDGIDVNRNVQSWQEKIGYVPQTIYFLDDTLRNNIAFGILPEDIDEKSVENAVKLAQLESFVSSLPDGLNTVIGENGTRISGGQRQRIGIARALYHHPQILVLDEATSALDHHTEDAIMESILKMQGEKTIIVIAHRLRTVAECDYLYMLRDGKVVSEGLYEEVAEK